MRIDNDSYYIKCWIVHDEEWVSMRHYIDVWDDGFSVDDYSVEPGYIDFEGAEHFGANPDDSRAGKRILKRYFDRWVKRINDCKSEIEHRVKSDSTPKIGECSVGDCFYYPSKEIRIAEYLKEFDEDISEEEGDEPDFCLFRIVEKEQGVAPKGTVIIVSKYTIDCGTKVEAINEEYVENIEAARCIPQETYDYAAILINKVSTEIMEEIKKEYCK